MAALRRQAADIDQQIEQRLRSLDYVDPALLDPQPVAESIEEIWFEDGFPEGANVESSGGPPLQLIAPENGAVYSGKLALRRKVDAQIAQDFFAKGAKLRVPDSGKFFAYCYLDPEDPPQAIMIQFHTNAWKNRAVWGDQEKINFGKPDTTEKVHMGDLPATGQWVRLEMEAKQLGLDAGTEVSGFAFTQFSGTITWDHFGVVYQVDKAKDPAWSWQVFVEQGVATIGKRLPDALRRQLQGRNYDQWTVEETEQVRKLWLSEIYAGTQSVLAPFKASKQALEQEISAIEKAAPVTFVMADLKKPRDSFVMLRGAYDNPGEQVQRGVPAFLPELPGKSDGSPLNRLDLANWLLRPDHPLTARVTVNRFWQQFFGNGLVLTSADFGSQGQPPSHPELLDWLATQFIADGWDTKQLVRRIVTSHAYRQSSELTPEQLARDPDNRLLARSPRLRLDAEVLRDQALFVSGLLVPAVGGPGVKPYQPPNIWEPVGFGNSNTRYYKQDSGSALYRRSLYTFLKRTAPPPFMSSFDAPNREQSCSLRGRTNTPMQALQLMNDIQHVEAARAFASRIILAGGKTAKQRIEWAWRVVTARQATEPEVGIALAALRQHQSRFEQDANRAAELAQYGESSPDPDIAPEQLAAYTMLANLLLNLDEAVTKN